MKTLALAGTLLFASTPAWALCPNCLGQSPSLPPTLRLVGLFLLVPPAVVAAVALCVRKILRPSVPPSAGGGDHGG